MSFEIILYRIVIAGLVFIVYMAVRKIKWQEKTIGHLQRINEKQAEKGVSDIMFQAIKQGKEVFEKTASVIKKSIKDKP